MTITHSKCNICDNIIDDCCLVCDQCKKDILLKGQVCEETDNGDVRAFGFPDLESAKIAADKFFREECCDDEGIILSTGHHHKWCYIDSVPSSFIEYHFFHAMDSEPLPREAYDY